MSESLSDTFPQESARSWRLPFGSPIYGKAEVDAVVSAMQEGHIATGVVVERFEKRFGEKLGHAHAIAQCSGSMANFLAVAALRELGLAAPGDRVLVSAATFITAISPVVQHGLVPVFVDLAPRDVNVDLAAVEAAISRHRPVAALLPHTLGQALDLDRLQVIKQRSKLFIIEDCCESLGATWRGRPIGTVGDVASFSFYAGHHLTTGEGGMLATSDPALAQLLRSLRAFGRDVSYAGPRFGYPVGDRPLAPEERYMHLRSGYNTKLTDLQAAMGLVQLNRLDQVVDGRRALASRIQELILSVPSLELLGDAAAPGTSPFAVVVSVVEPFSRDVLAQTLLEHGIDVRGMLGASSAHQPCFDGVAKIVHEPLTSAERAARRALIIGCPPGLDDDAACAALAQALGAWREKVEGDT